MNPHNDFDNFFTDEQHPAMHLAKPTPEAVLEALIRVVGLRPLWYRDPTLRLMVVKGLDFLTQELHAALERGEKPAVDLIGAAFCMVLAERIESSKRFASPEEEKWSPKMDDHPQDNE